MSIQNKRMEIINRILGGYAEDKPVQPANGKEMPELIAIIGLSGYLPQSASVNEFWNALDNDRSLMEEIPSTRIDWKNKYDPLGKDPDKSHTKWGGIIPNIRNFDPELFGILPSEAALMDPRKRLLLMSVYHTIEDAGYAPGSFKKSNTGVFIAIEEDEYMQCMRESGTDAGVVIWDSSSLIANQISYYFDLKGPSEVVNTMCSGAAVAIHRAVGALRSGEISCAVVGAANLLLHSDPFIFLSRTGQMSATNTVSSYGKDAKGFLRSDGVASILLKPLSKALEDGDAVYALIRNTAVNYNGKGGFSMAAPNVSSHAELIRRCYRGADINPTSISYIETQGMGNPVADIAEWDACNRALKEIARDKGVQLENGSCRISTLKPMIGHMHAASALGALFKIIRSFQTNTIHKILDFNEINPELDTADQPCRLALETENWPEDGYPRLAGLHSYGSGGNNAHLLIEEYKAYPADAEDTGSDAGKLVMPFSAKTKDQCITLVKNLLVYMAEYPDHSLASIAYTMANGREGMKYRVAFAAHTREEFIDQAGGYLKGHIAEGVFERAASEKPAGLPIETSDIVSKAKAWVNGADIVWEKASFKTPVSRLHLPGYPFNCKEYWFDMNDDHLLKDKPQKDRKNDQPQRSVKAENMVREFLSTFLLIPPGDIDLEKEFSDLGFDSMMVTKITASLNQRYGLDMEPAVFFEHTTPAKLITFISRQFAAELGENKNVPAPGHMRKNKKMPGKYDVEFQPVAIIGVSGSFPHSPSPELLWQNLVNGNNCIEEIPRDRWLAADYFHPDVVTANREGKSYAKWGGFLEGYYHFDPLFFNISPSETEIMSPKERLFLQCAWHVLEDAGYTPQALLGEKVGVFAGVTRSGIDPYKISPFTISNRVSYVLNLTGPSMTIDTACSSSLVAIHEACQHIYTGECSIALAGGVHVFLDPTHFSVLSGMYMLSPDGVSRSFGDHANGMVPGEGVGILMLKPLNKAVEDRDHIYGVIRGSSMNHGGKTNGFTVPNPRAHQDLIQSALQKARINAREVSYVEAHGTGTLLGDPIEIRGLTEAFRIDTADTQFCRIGSIKSNIGHLEAAAGVSGLIKVLLQMKYKKLVPSLHSRKLNPQIDFLKTPFAVQQELENWNPKDEEGKDIPRIACVSSFGAGGANAHIILEEYPLAEIRHEGYVHGDKNNGNSFIILLSAKNEDRLNEYARQLLLFIKESGNGTYHNLANLAYTLQVGRVEFEERLAFDVQTPEELICKLEDFLDRKKNVENIYRGSVRDHKETMAVFANDPDMSSICDGWMHTKNFSRILSFWCKGLSFDWQKLYDPQPAEQQPCRISIHGYPFGKELYGLPDISFRNGTSIPSAIPVIHPLVHQNTSSFFEQRFSSRFTGEEFFLRDHVVDGEKFLPGVAYLEMVNVAINAASNNTIEAENLLIQLNNVAWTQPTIVSGRPVEVHTSLFTEKNREMRFEIYSRIIDDKSEKKIHSQGSARLTVRSDTPKIDINEKIHAADHKIFGQAECYRAFERMGIVYGPAHRGIEQLYAGKEHVLAKLMIPAAVAGTMDQFRLHPSMADAAFQSIIGFMMRDMGDGDELPLAIPFALEELTVYSPCTPIMWVLIRMNGNMKVSESKVSPDQLFFDIDLMDGSGTVCARIKKYKARLFKKGVDRSGSSHTMLIHPAWQEEEMPDDLSVGDAAKRIIIYWDAEENEASGEGLKLQTNESQIFKLGSVNKRIDGRIRDYTLQLIEKVRELLIDKSKDKLLLQLVVPAVGEEKLIAALFGLLRTAEIENPKIKGELIDRQSGRRLKMVLKEYNPSNKIPAHPWKKDGVYLITGGMGGLGLIFAKEILSKVPGATLILTGRSAMDDHKRTRLNELLSKENIVEYRQVDISREEEVNELVKSINQRFGGLNGIIHGAGVLNDGFIIHKTPEAVTSVLVPKMQGLVNLDLATKHLEMDVFILCSSSTSVIGNLAQADYAVANAFMDEYALYRNTLVLGNERKGHTVSINWPLWREGGMQVNKKIQEGMFETIGMTALETGSGIQALYQVIASGYGQMMVMQGNLKRLRNELLTPSFSVAGNTIQIAMDNDKQFINRKDEPGAGDLKEKAVFYFKKMMSGVIKLPVARIGADTAMEEYGIDSIMIMQMTRELEKVFGSLPKTLFFEYRNINELAEYFMSSNAERLSALLGSGSKNVEEGKLNTNEGNTHGHSDILPDTMNGWKTDRFANNPFRPLETKTHDKGLEVAIIGLAGRYPQARNLKQFWENLRNGRNSVTEIPPERWDYHLHFDPDKNKKGKTYTRWGGFIEGVDEFDPLFFNISPKEATVLDPQERLFLQCVYEALEDAGYTRDTLSVRKGSVGNVGVYVGVMWEEYHLYAAEETALGRPMVLSSSPSSIANRVSYYFNFNGPSMAVDTMCSSSLTSIHLACQGMQQGECEVAIAGGVNVSIHPNKYLVLGYGKYASSKGLCESFGTGGDGYVAGEGIGAVLLKPLSKAIADKDHIYGVIRGTAVNHGGKTSGFTVPDPRAQASVIEKAIKMAGFDSRTISYLEAHGTGTALGDPIEIAGLSKAFNTSEKKFCAIGSVKSNIGHCESAAGIAGITKVLLQMKYGQLVPSLHSTTLNPNIDFENSPFVVQQELAEWRRPLASLDGGDVVQYPRRAGISSFGAGGANAHVVIEEYTPEEPEHMDAALTVIPQHAVAVILSAKTEDGLKEMAGMLLSAMKELKGADLVSLAYTLQVGREAMEYRLALEVSSMEELQAKLLCFSRGEDGIENLYSGKVALHKEIFSLFNSDEDMERTVEYWFQKRKYSKLLSLWVNGFNLDWNKLYVNNGSLREARRRISLPTYPFLRNRCWPELGNGKVITNAGSGSGGVLHPLVHRNTSTFTEQQFTSVFTGEEFFLKDHLVNGKRLLPGAACLEMVNEAVAISSGERKQSIRLDNVVWIEPIIVNGQPEKVNIGLFPQENGEVHFKIYHQRDTDNSKQVVYSQGIVQYELTDQNQVLEIATLQAGAGQHSLNRDELYKIFSGIGIAYGPAQQGIENLYTGTGYVLAKLSLPAAVGDTLGQYYLHPSLIDSSFQAVIGFWANQKDMLENAPVAVPFAIKSLEVFSRCTRNMWAFIRHSAGQGINDKINDTGQLLFDIDVCDEYGKLCVQIVGFAVRIMTKKESNSRKWGTLMMEPVWRRKQIAFLKEPVMYSKHYIVVIENKGLATSISGQPDGAVIIPLDTSYPSIAEGFEDYAISVFKELKQLLGSKIKGRLLMQVIIPSNGEKQMFSAIDGLLKTARLENPNFTGQVIGIGEEETAATILLKIRENSQAPSDAMIRYRNNIREIAALQEWFAPEKDPGQIWENDAVYLITGGAGALGLIFAGEISRAVKGATVILTGRSSLNSEREKELSHICSTGMRISYRQADITDEKTVAGLIQGILDEYGQLNGIIHSAGIFHDNFIIKKSEEEIREVLAPKVRGMYNIDLATRDIPLDFFMVCSSTSAMTGNTGQADYAMANAFMDRYAGYRAELVRGKHRSGKTLSVNWPLWKEGGMQPTAEFEKYLLNDLGMIPMETGPGLKALGYAMASNTSQMMLAQGDLTKLRTTFLEGVSENTRNEKERAAIAESSGVQPSRTGKDKYNKALAVDYLKNVLSDVISLPAEQINADKPMEEYGIDSVMVMQMTSELEKTFGSLSKTLFFEYTNIRELADYLFDVFPDKFKPLLTDNTASAPLAGQESLIKTEHNRFSSSTRKMVEKQTVPDPLQVAIIGLAGHYPCAADLQAFWQVLKEGRNCITEIPKDRWDHNMYFDPQRNKPGKTYGKWGAFLDHVEAFDPLFFGISAGEAELLDPQERLFLQCAYETLEDAGYTRRTGSSRGELQLTGNVGVYVGVMWDEYQLYGAQETALGRPLSMSGVPGSIANRVSYFCNFNGPSIALNTMCSSSLTAIHLACQSIHQGECDAAIAGGVNVTLHPNKYLVLGNGNFLSSKGQCESFGAGGDGYVPGEGVGAVLLKPLSRAIADNDQIYGVIKGTSINHGGKTNGYTVPNPKAQGNVIDRAIKMSGFDPRTISYLEAHGTGTSLGDPIEITGFKRAFGTAEEHFCPIGSVKSNIGHCESAAGIAGLTKVLLQMKYRQLVPSLHSSVLNPNIDFENSSFVVQQQLTEWKRPVLSLDGKSREYPRRAGVSSLGAGGSNAHILLEEYIPDIRKDVKIPGKAVAGKMMPIVLSARNEPQLKQQARRLLAWIQQIENTSENSLMDVAYTLQVGREPMKERMAMAASSFQELETNLKKYIAEESSDNIYRGRVYDLYHDPEKTVTNHDMDDHPDSWMATGSYAKLLTAWVSGVSFDWNKLYAGMAEKGCLPRRISLPTYPFAMDRYWFPQKAGVGVKETIHQPAQYQLPEPAPEAEIPDRDLLLERIGIKLKLLFADIVKYDPGEIDQNDPLENYGINSTMIVQLNKKLADVYGELPATIFYEYQTLDALTGFLVRDHYDISANWAGLDNRSGDPLFYGKENKALPGNNVNVPSREGRSNARKPEKNKDLVNQNRESIAIIGMSGRYPGAKNLQEYWENLKAGKDCVTEIPGDRWDVDDFFHADATVAASLGKSYSKWGGFVDGFADFDPLFFGMSPKEARGTDPQIRLFIESCWQMLEDAGYTRQHLMDSYNANVGVFAGITRAGFLFYAPELMKNGQYYLNTMSAVANRVSYILNLKGPSIPVDTMCSSSLTAIHEACESILAGRCEMAIAGGVNLLLHPSEYVILSANNFLSSDGRCRSFGAGGDGYVPGEGVGAVLLKPLSKAIADKDNIYAVIRSTAINHGGKTNGYTVPNPVAQGELIRTALDNAGINARHISYMEAHGTGTSLGDPIEIAGINQAFRADTADKQYCAIGSSKSNIGHLEAAAGIAGLTKIVLQMKHRMLVPSLHAEILNPNINFEKSPFFVQQTLSEWKRPFKEEGGRKIELTRIAGISSFGAGGSNAHVILEEYVPEDVVDKQNTCALKINDRRPAIILLSAKNEDRVKEYARSLLATIRQEYTDLELPAIAYTLQVGREAMDERLAMEVTSVNDLVEKLEAFISGQMVKEGIFRGNEKDHKETISILSADKDMALTIKAWISGGKYGKLLGLWVKGLDLDWNKLYVNDDNEQTELPGRISLPGYPFDRKKYWIVEENKEEIVKGQRSPVMSQDNGTVNNAIKKPSFSKEELYQLLTFEETWQEKAIERSLNGAEHGPVSKLVCFLSNKSDQHAIEAAIKELDKTIKVIFVCSDKGGSANGITGQYYIDKNNDPESYISVFNQIILDYGEIDAVAYLWPVEDISIIRDYNSLVAILQGIGRGKIKIKQFLLTGQWHTQIGVSDISRCFLESWMGFERSFRLVLPAVRLKVVYQELPVNNTDIKDWFHKIWAELNCSETRSALYKEGRRYVCQIRPNNIQTRPTRLKKGGTYMITGGLGKLGFLFASYLADKYGANLILTGRSSLDTDKLEEISKLESLGGRVFYLQADVCDMAAMRDGIEKAKQRFGSINGVIHASGVIGAQMFLDKTPDGFQQVLAPKINGTIVLDDILKEEPLDYVCYFTSSSAILGDFGACDYSIANRFQMSFAAYRSQLEKLGQRKGKTFAVNWPLWKDGGMDLNDKESTKMYLKSSGQRYLLTEEGIDIFEQLITQESVQHLVLVGQEGRIKRFLGLQQEVKEKIVNNVPAAPNPVLSQPAIKGSTVEQLLEWDLVDLVSKAQQIPKEDIRSDTNLADLGFDSISLSTLALALSHHFGVELAPAVFFSYSSIEKLKEYFLREYHLVAEELYRNQAEKIVHQPA